MRILIADDDATSLMVLSTVLAGFGHNVVDAVNGLEAWEMLQRPDAPRMAILDWMMPGLEGAEICRRVREIPSACPPYLILLTARAQKADVAHGLRAGADDYLSKPFSALELGARVEVGCRMIALQEKLAGKIGELEEAIAHIKTLRGIVPICAGCKKIRDDQGYWNQVEAYVSAHSEARFSHGICPECMVQYLAEMEQPNAALR